jgi:hypothetical protein
MSDSFVLSLPWSRDELSEIEALISKRRKIASLLFICFLALCSSSYVATSCDVDYVTSTDQASFEYAWSKSSVADRKIADNLKESSLISSIKDQSLIINLIVLAFGAVVLIYFMNRLNAIENELELRMEQAFASSWTDTHHTAHVVSNVSVDSSVEVHMRHRHQSFFLTASGWLARNNAMMLRRGSRANIAAGVSDRISEKWSRMLIQITHNMQVPSTNENDRTQLISPIGSTCYGSLDKSTVLQEYATISNATCCKEEIKIREYLGEDCSICLSDYIDGDIVVCLPCGHIYHDACLSHWISRSIRCPLCRCNLEEADSRLEVTAMA